MKELSQSQDNNCNNNPKKNNYLQLIMRTVLPSGVLSLLMFLICATMPIILYHTTDMGYQYRADLPHIHDYDTFSEVASYVVSYILPLGIFWGSRWGYFFMLTIAGYSLRTKRTTHDVVASWVSSVVLLIAGITYPVSREMRHLFGQPLGDHIAVINLFFSILLFCGIFSYSVTTGSILSDISQSNTASLFLRRSARFLLPVSAMLEFFAIFVSHPITNLFPTIVPPILLTCFYYILFRQLPAENDKEWIISRLGLPLFFGCMLIASSLLWGTNYNPFFLEVKKIFPGRFLLLIAWSIGYLVGWRASAPGVVDGMMNFVRKFQKNDISSL